MFKGPDGGVSRSRKDLLSIVTGFLNENKIVMSSLPNGKRAEFLLLVPDLRNEVQKGVEWDYSVRSVHD